MIVNNVDVNRNSLKTILLFFTASPLVRNTVNDYFIITNVTKSRGENLSLSKVVFNKGHIKRTRQTYDEFFNVLLLNCCI